LSITLIITVGLAAFSTVLYNLFQKLTPGEVNPALALSVTYLVSLVLTLLLLFVFPVGNLADAFKKLNWASFALGLAIAGVEVSTLLAYRAGGGLSFLGIMVNVVASLLLVFLGTLVFKEKLNFINFLGVLVCIVGLAMINFKR
jgi:uncharacterized membrane protein